MIKSPEAKERKRIYNRERRKRLNADPVWREKELARKRKYNAEHKEQRHQYYLAHKAETRARQLKYKKEHPEEWKAHQKKWRDAHLSECRALQHFWRLERDELHRRDPEAYAKHRARKRGYVQAKRGDKYKPHLKMRIPDWACKGQDIIDYRSQFLRDNRTLEQKAYAKDLYRERYAK